MRLYLIGLSLLLLVFTSACVSSPKSPEPLASPPVGGSIGVSVPPKTFAITASNWKFEPSTVTVNEGDTVKLTITSVAGFHGFSLPDFGINVQLPAGETKTAEFVASKRGTFTFSCSVPCGSGHGSMKGTLVVQ